MTNKETQFNKEYNSLYFHKQSGGETHKQMNRVRKLAGKQERAELVLKVYLQLNVRIRTGTKGKTTKNVDLLFNTAISAAQHHFVE
jgi:hypothetical protein